MEAQDSFHTGPIGAMIGKPGLSRGNAQGLNLVSAGQRGHFKA